MSEQGSYTFDAIGTRWWITCDTTSAQQLARITKSIRSHVAAFEAEFSRFVPTSALSTLNNTKRLEAPSTAMLALLRYGLDVHKHTAGLYNMSVGGVLEQQGYGQQADNAARIEHNADAIFTEYTTDRIAMASHVRIDLGGIGKGWLIDEVAEMCTAAKLQQCSINAGGDIRACGNTPITIALEHPTRPGEQIGTIELADEGFAASSIFKRRWTANTATHSHIVNPRYMGHHKAIAAFVRGPTARIADTVCTVLLIADTAQREQIARHYNVEYLIVTPGMQAICSPQFNAQLNQ